jgi:transcription initiation factor TFIID subunit 9B
MEIQNTPMPGPNGIQPDEENAVKRPRDAHLIHTLLATQGVTSYQERVPLMLIDFAYRYTRSILSDAATLSAEGYGGPASAGGTEEQRRGRAAAGSSDDVTMTAARLAASARQIGQLPAHMSKADLIDLAGETNRIGLPPVRREFGMRLPGDKFLLTGGAFRLQDEWEEDEEEGPSEQEEGGGGAEPEDTVMADDDDADGGLLDEDMEEDEFEEVMGTGDTKMQE